MLRLGSVTFAPKLWSGLISDFFYPGTFIRFPLLALALLFGVRASFALILDPQQHPPAPGMGSWCPSVPLPSWGFASGTLPGLSQLKPWTMAPIPLPLPQTDPVSPVPLLPNSGHFSQHLPCTALLQHHPGVGSHLPVGPVPGAQLSSSFPLLKKYALICLFNQLIFQLKLLSACP